MQKKEDKIVVLHDPKLHEFWIGGTQETVESLHTSLSNHMHEERVFYHDPRISEYLRDEIEEISKEFAAVSSYGYWLMVRCDFTDMLITKLLYHYKILKF